MNRRSFLLGGLALLLAAPGQWWRSSSTRHSEEACLISELSNARVSAIRLGKMYLLDHPEYRDSHQLVELILHGCTARQRQLAASDPRCMRKLLNEKIRQDFLNQNVLRLDGWQLSTTEVQQWALMALVAA